MREEEEEGADAGRDELALAAAVPHGYRWPAEGVAEPPPTRTETPAATGTQAEAARGSYAAQQELLPTAGKLRRLAPPQPPIHASAAADSQLPTVSQETARNRNHSAQIKVGATRMVQFRAIPGPGSVLI